MRDAPPTVTSLPPSPDEERHGRMIKYSIAMGIRIVCIVLAVVVPGWWALVPVLGAVFLPYFAVLIANNTNLVGSSVERPGGIVPVIRVPREDGRA